MFRDFLRDNKVTIKLHGDLLREEYTYKKKYSIIIYLFLQMRI